MNSICCEIIKTCPLSCVHCSAKSHINTNRFIQLNDIKKIIDNTPNTLNTFFISGGEPLLHPNINEIISYLKSKDIEPVVYSSGCNISKNKKTIEPFSSSTLKELENNGLSRIVFSLYSLKESQHDNITQTKNSLNTLKKTIQNANKCFSKVTIELSFIPLQDTANEIKNIISFSEKQNISKINILKLINQGRAKESGIILKSLSDVEEKNFLTSIKSYHNPSFTIEVSKLYECNHYENLEVSPYTAGVNESFITYSQENLPGRRFRDLAK